MSSLKELEAFGGFVPSAPVKKTITFQIDDQEYTADIFIKRLSVGDYEALFLSDKEERSRTAKLISECVFLKDGKERISFEKAYTLRPELATAMMNAWSEVNTQKKASRPATASSVTSQAG